MLLHGLLCVNWHHLHLHHHHDHRHHHHYAIPSHDAAPFARQTTNVTRPPTISLLLFPSSPLSFLLSLSPPCFIPRSLFCCNCSLKDVINIRRIEDSFVLEEQLGEGGFSIVYRGYNKSTRQRVA
eukprot:53159-Rhodomonas_salina.1